MTYGQDGKSITITAGNAFGAWNTTNGNGYMFVDYGNSGSGGNDYTETVLYTASSTSASNLVLSEDFDKFDAIVFCINRGVEVNHINLPYLVSDLAVNINLTLISYASEYINYTITDKKTLTKSSSSGDYYVNKVVGIKYGSGGSGGGDNDDLSDKTWTLIVSTTGTSAATDIPAGTEWIVLTAEMSGIISEVARERVSNISKLLDVSQLSTWGMGYEWADTQGNHTTVSMSISSGKVTVKSGYNTVTVKAFGVA